MIKADTPQCGKNLQACTRSHPGFHDIVASFKRVLLAQRQTVDSLSLHETCAITCTEDEFLSGTSLATKLHPAVFLKPFKQSAAKVWPELAKAFPALSESLEGLERELQNDVWCTACLEALVHGNGQSFEAALRAVQVEPQVLLACLRIAYVPCITAIRPVLAEHPSVKLWRKRFCPICGSDPDMGTLELHATGADFVVSKSGQAWLHCPQCGQHWRFSRAVCPACGTQENSSLTRYFLPEEPREFIYACDACKHYLPYKDLTENTDDTECFDRDATSLEFMHLDAMAQASGYEPLSPVLWANLGLTGDGELAPRDAATHNFCKQEG